MLWYAVLAGLSAITVQSLPFSSPQGPKPLPSFAQPVSTKIDLGASFSLLSTRDKNYVTIEVVAAAATKALAKKLNLNEREIKVSNAHTSSTSGIHSVHFVQLVDGIELANAAAIVNANPSGSILSVYSSLSPHNNPKGAQKQGQISPEVAVFKYAESQRLSNEGILRVKQTGEVNIVSGARFAVQDIKAKKKWYRNGKGGLVPVWDLNIALGHKWMNIFVNARTGEIEASNCWTSHLSDATYYANQPFSRNPINSTLAELKNPWNLKASPQGWQVVSGVENKDLSGNNVVAVSNPDGAPFASDSTVLTLPRLSNDSLVFKYPLNDTLDPMEPSNANAAVVNMFVAANTAHDIFYNYGFTEAAGNFQFNNFGKGGVEGDGVIATAQESYKTDPFARNNAYFSVPPDGESGRLATFIFTGTEPNRDSALDNMVVYHEMAHGLSGRLTGGSSSPNCLLSYEISGGMGEGWSDTIACVMTMPASSSSKIDIVFASYLGKNGARTYPYSTNLTANPLTYSYLGTAFIISQDENGGNFKDVHKIGEIWASILLEVLWKMVSCSGWVSPSKLATSQASRKGNADFLSLLVQGMKIQPCNPTFIQARDAILDSDKAMFNGKYSCAIWKGFAKRGLGLGAKEGGTFKNCFVVPLRCARSLKK
ncbi:Fungalysin/Thermolysin Extracellular metalloproteinase 5 [Chytriomyces hyalinus]|nr:Fungalysin/Thermolysin Extracellular metalloproteinase 5 [Chytriomyces hyalinus]